jgi:hypothetical protein
MIVVLIQYPVQLKRISRIIISVSANINLTLDVVQGPVQPESGPL